MEIKSQQIFEVDMDEVFRLIQNKYNEEHNTNHTFRFTIIEDKIQFELVKYNKDEKVH